MTSSSNSSQDFAERRETKRVSETLLKQQHGSGFHKKLKPSFMQVITNIQVVKDLDKQERLELDNNNEVIFGSSEHKEIYETFFPRLAYLDLDGSLIQTHLDIFKMIRPLFQKFLETRERLNCDEKDYKAMHKRKQV